MNNVENLKSETLIVDGQEISEEQLEAIAGGNVGQAIGEIITSVGSGFGGVLRGAGNLFGSIFG